MKTVKIPDNMNPYKVRVNGVLYEYPAGATVEVPDEVAKIIEQTQRGPNLPPSSGGGDGGSGADLLNENGVIKQEHFPEGYPYPLDGVGEIFPETTLPFV